MIKNCRVASSSRKDRQMNSFKGVWQSLLSIKIIWHVAWVAVLTSCGGGGSGGIGDPNTTGIAGQTSDALAMDLPIAYVRRTLPVDEDGNPAVISIFEPATFNAGADLFIRERASEEADELNVTSGVFPDGELYDVKDLDVSFDGASILFSMRAPEDEDADEDEQPTWNIWEYDFDDGELRRIILADNTAEAGEDVSPRYLPDGRILFSSTRQRRSRAVLLDEGKPQYAAQVENEELDGFVLHTMEPDGTDIQQISFNQSHDLFPTVLEDGRVMFLRWDNANNNDSLSLYTINPDGSGLSFMYGLHSQNTGTNGTEAPFWVPRELPDGRILAIHNTPETEALGGDMIAIDVANFSEIDQPLPDSFSSQTVGQEALTALPVTIDGTPSPHGMFASAWPLEDGTERLFVSWSQCRLQDIAMTEIVPCTDANQARDDVETAEPLYGLWMYDVIAETQQPIVVPEEGIMYSDAVVVESRPTPTFIPNLLPDADLAQEDVAILNIRSVYDFDGVDLSPTGIETTRDPALVTPDQRPARFLRIEKAVSIPDEDTRDFDNSAFGAGGQGQQMREIIGYTPIEPDGSVIVRVPSDVALAVSVLDGDGHRITQRHENWMHFETGDTIACNGCHTANSELVHGRLDAQLPSANPGAPNGFSSFPNTESSLFIDQPGETMAEVWTRINGVRTPTTDIVFSDDWTDPDTLTPAESFSWAYADLQTPAPTQASCFPSAENPNGAWNSLCRIVVNYVDHLQPIWDLERPILDEFDVEQDNLRCTLCHSETNEELLIDQVPAAQLDLTGGPSIDNADFLTSYQELFFQNNSQVLDDDGNLIMELVDSGDIVIDGNGDPILDDDGNVIPIFIPVPVDSILRAAGANASDQFFQVFEAGAVHDDYLTPVELKLISEWLDIGAQYYNDPFDAPED